MKKMTCRQLGGACDLEFEAATFEEKAKLSQSHGKAMFEAQDAAHLKAMEDMRVLMAEPAKMQAWFEARQAEFDALPSE